MLRADQLIQLIVVSLLALAVVMVQSAAMSVSQEHLTLQKFLLNRTTIYALLAVVAMFLASRLDIRVLARYHGWSNPIFWILAITMLLVVAAMIPGVGVTINGAQRWLRLGPASWGLTFQPSELLKWAMVLAVALWCARRPALMKNFREGLLPPLLGIAIACLLIIKEDLGTAALLGMVSFILLLAGGARIWHLLLTVPPALLALLAAILISPYRRTRLTSFLDPFADPRGTGYQAIQSMLAVAQGRITGRGLGHGVQKFGYLPSDTTDFIFANICEELGLPGAILVIGLYLTLLWIGLSILKHTRDLFSRLVVLGVILTISLQALINLAVVTVLVPTKGIALPLLSSGGTGWIMTAFVLGLVAGLHRAQSQEQHLPSLSTTSLCTSHIPIHT